VNSTGHKQKNELTPEQDQDRSGAGERLTREHEAGKNEVTIDTGSPVVTRIGGAFIDVCLTVGTFSNDKTKEGQKSETRPQTRQHAEKESQT
jgi:hypothetical protein